MFGARMVRDTNVHQFFSALPTRKKKKAQVVNIPKSNHQRKITSWKTLWNENWSKRIDFCGHASLCGCPPRNGVLYIKKFSKFKRSKNWYMQKLITFFIVLIVSTWRIPYLEVQWFYEKVRHFCKDVLTACFWYITSITICYIVPNITMPRANLIISWKLRQSKLWFIRYLEL